MRCLICMQKSIQICQFPKWYKLQHHGLIQQTQNISHHSTQRHEHDSTPALLISTHFISHDVHPKGKRSTSLFSREAQGQIHWNGNGEGLHMITSPSSGPHPSQKWPHSVCCERWRSPALQHRNYRGGRSEGHSILQGHWITLTRRGTDTLKGSGFSGKHTAPFLQIAINKKILLKFRF